MNNSENNNIDNIDENLTQNLEEEEQPHQQLQQQHQQIERMNTKNRKRATSLLVRNVNTPIQNSYVVFNFFLLLFKKF
jgi:hypothetical protein